MLSPADADLVARDHGLPGLALLLDAEAFQETLHGVLPDRRLGAIRIDYLRYKPCTNCLSAFTLDLDGILVRGYAKAHQLDDWGKLMKAAQRPSRDGPLGPGRLIFAEDAIEVAIFPNDNKLKTLGRLFDDTSGPQLLASVFRDRPDLQAGTVNHLRYKPERRFVGRLDIDGEPRAVLKLYRQCAYAAARTAAETLDAASSLLGHSTRHGLLAFEWRHGTQLRDSIAGPVPALASIERVGAALAEFHNRDGDGLRVRDRASEIVTIQALAEALTILHPPLARLASELVRKLTTGLRHAPAVNLPIHGDFYDRQVLVDDGRIVILDLDEAVLSDPAADLGLFVAHLVHAALSCDLQAARVAPVRDALLAGYGVPPERVDLYTAIGLLQLAPHHFRNREPNWSERTEATLERALTIVSPHAASLA